MASCSRKGLLLESSFMAKAGPLAGGALWTLGERTNLSKRMQFSVRHFCGFCQVSSFENYFSIEM